MTKLEEIFLMNVAIYFPSYIELFHFMKINKKCLRTVHRLKRTPYFIDQNAYESFLERFHPETIDFNHSPRYIKEAEEECHLIRNASFIVEKMKENELQKIVSLFPKIDTINLYIDHKFTDLQIEHAEKFEKIKKITGDLSLLIKFFERYTENGKQLFVPLPEIINIKSYDGKRLELNEMTVEKIEEFLKYIRINDCCTINAFFQTQSKKSEHINELFQRLKRINYYYYINVVDACEMYSDNIALPNNNLMIKEGIGSNEMNTMINKCYAQQIFCGETNNRDNRFIIKTQSFWNLPEFVETLMLSNFISERFMKTIYPEYQSTMNEQIDTTYNSFPISFDYLTKITLDKCVGVYIKEGLFNLKELIIISSINVEISNRYLEDDEDEQKENANNHLKHLELLKICHSRTVEVNLFSSQLKKLIIYFSKDCDVTGPLETLENVYLRKSERLKFNSFSFENKKVMIEECDDVKFISHDSSLTNPLEYCNIPLSKTNILMKNYINIPDQPLVTESNIFTMKSFHNNSDNFEIIDSTRVKRINYHQTFCETIFSRNFYNINDNFEYIQVLQQDGTTKLLPSTIRYFELNVFGYNVISIGVVCNEIYDFIDGHVGWRTGSVGYHADDGLLFQEHGIGKEFDLPYGKSENENHVVGCGYDCEKQEVFFTRDGIKNMQTIHWEIDSLFAAIGLSDFREFEINYGNKPFMFDLIKEYEENGYI